MYDALPKCLLSAIVIAWCASPRLAASQDQANWPRWRGPNDNGSQSQGTYPVKWDSTNVLWKATLPGKGCSTPAVWAKRIYLTAPIEGRDSALAFDWAGKSLWQTSLGPERAGKNPNGSGCNPSPATDGQSVFVYFKSGTLAGLDLDGHLRWETNLIKGFGPEVLNWDQGTSPVLTERAVVIARMHHGDSWLAAFDKATGHLLWKVDRNYVTPEEGDHGYSTPLLIRQNDRDCLLVWGSQHLTCNDASNGQLLWSCGNFNPRAIANWPAVASPVLAGDLVVLSGGREDRNQPRLFGVRLGGHGDVTSTNHVWERQDTGAFVPTPALYAGRLFLLQARGQIECLDPATGKTLWREAFPRSTANFYASPVIAAGKLYAAREDGVVFVAQVEGPFEILAQNAMGERVIASPVPIDSRLLIRGEKHLFCISGE
jgi:outer membrane protein assembly factor BamB